MGVMRRMALFPISSISLLLWDLRDKVPAFGFTFARRVEWREQCSRYMAAQSRVLEGGGNGTSVVLS